MINPFLTSRPGTLLLWLCLFCGVAAVAQAPVPAPISAARDRLAIPVSINGIGPYPMLLDSCTRHPVLDLEVAAYLGLGDWAAPLGLSEAQSWSVGLESIEVANVPPFAEYASVLDMSGMGFKMGQRVAGLLPAYLPGQEVFIDASAPSVAWRPAMESSLSPSDQNVTLMRVSESGAPEVDALLDGRHLQPLRIDLAYPGTIGLTPGTLRKLGQPRSGEPEMRLQRQGAPVEYLRLAELRVAGNVVESPVCTVRAEEAGDCLGVGFLRAVRLTLNFEFGLASFEPLTSDRLRDPARTGYGLALDALQEGYWSLAVAEGSPAAEAGVEPGDRLVSINDLTGALVAYPEDGGWRLLSAALAAEPGTQANFVLLRGAEPWTVLLTSVRLI